MRPGERPRPPISDVRPGERPNRQPVGDVRPGERPRPPISDVRPGERPRPGSGNPGGPPPQWHRQPSSPKVTNIQINFGGYNRYWTPSWYARYPYAWHPYWITPYHWWHRPTWDYTCTWFGRYLLADLLNPRVYYPYYYGSNIVYRDHIVYIDDVRYVTADEFYGQAWHLAHTPVVIEEISKSEDDWLSLGTFAVYKEETEKDTGLLIQLAANKNGQILGNIVDEAADKVWMVSGAVEPETQRVAFRLDGDDELVYECGLWNLTQDTAPMLVHLGTEEQAHWTLIRLVNSTESAPKKNSSVIVTSPSVQRQVQTRQYQPRQPAFRRMR